MKKMLYLFVLIMIVLNYSFPTFAQEPAHPKLNGIVCNKAGAYVAVGSNGIIIVSWDGESWSKCESNTTQTLNDIVWARNQFVAVGNEGTILASEDGVSWLKADSNTDSDICSITCNGGQFVAVGSSGNVLISTNGYEWTKTRMATMESLKSVRWLEDEFVAVGENMLILASLDGVSWEVVMSDPNSELEFLDIARGKDRYVIVGNSLSVFTSDDRKVWAQSEINRDTEGKGVQCLFGAIWDGNNFLAVGQDGGIFQSGDGLIWEGCERITKSELRGILKTQEGYYIVGNEGAIIKSHNGIDWKDLREITLDLGEPNIIIGQERQLKITLNYPYGAQLDITDKASYDLEGNIVSINEKGLLKASGEGEAKIRVEYDRKLSKFPLTVSNTQLSDIQRDEGNLSNQGENQNPKTGDTAIKIIISIFVLLALICAIAFYRKKVYKNTK